LFTTFEVLVVLFMIVSAVVVATVAIAIVAAAFLFLSIVSTCCNLPGLLVLTAFRCFSNNSSLIAINSRSCLEFPTTPKRVADFLML
jgi:hypothetical protein